MFLNLVRKIYRYPDPEENGGNDKSKEQGENKPDDTSTVALAKAYKDLQENTVSKADYEKLQKENRDLVNQILNGDGNAVDNGQATPPEKVDIEALKEKLYGPKSSELSNLDYWTLTLQLRDAVIERDGADPFLPHGANIKPTSEDALKAQNVATIVKECIDASEGDSGVFTALLQSKINNDSQAMTAHLKKLGLITK